MKFCKFHRKNTSIEALFNRVAGQETQTQMFSSGVYEFFKNLRTTASKPVVLPGVYFLITHFGSN